MKIIIWTIVAAIAWLTACICAEVIRPWLSTGCIVVSIVCLIMAWCEFNQEQFTTTTTKYRKKPSCYNMDIKKR